MATNVLYTAETSTAGTTTTRAARVVRHAPGVARSALGLVFFVFGLNGFLNFIPPPTEALPDAAVALAGAFMQSGYLFPLIKGTEVFGGLLLLTGRFVPLALTVLAPVVVNIVAFHLWLLPSGTGLALVMAALELYLAWAHRHAFAPLLRARATPAGR